MLSPLQRYWGKNFLGGSWANMLLFSILMGDGLVVQRWRLRLQYQGTQYAGWQRQPAQVTVQGLVEEALSAVANHPVEVVCAGRTDSGVHANEQVIHFDAQTVREESAWLQGANAKLPASIKIWAAEKVDTVFHARFSAKARQYHYYIYNAPLADCFLADRVWWVRQNLCTDRMQQAARLWLGEQDFSSFRDRDCQAPHPRRRLLGLQVAKQGRTVKVTITANAFLHHMVRNMMGVLVPIGLKQKPVGWAYDVLQARSRQAAGITAPSCGLYLHKVWYKEQPGDKKKYDGSQCLAESPLFPYDSR